MKGIMGAMNVAVRAMQNAQFNMQIASQNIAGAYDPGYTKRTTQVGSDSYIPGPGVVRSRDVFVDGQYRNANAGLGYAEARHQMLSRVEDVFADPAAAGIRKAMDAFFDGWRSLAENPNDNVARLEVLRTGQSFVTEVKTAYNRVTAAIESVGVDLTATVKESNDLIVQVGDMNRRVAELERNREDSAGMRDQRDKTVDRLSKLTGATSVEQSDGTVRLFIGSLAVIDGPNVLQMQMTNGPLGPTPQWQGVTIAYNGGGTLRGMMDVRQNDLDKVRTQIDSLAKSVANEINTVHESGVGLTDNVSRKFFDVGSSPADIAVNSTLQAGQIAAAATAGALGDGTQAQAIVDLQSATKLNSAIVPTQKVTFGGYFRDLVGSLGSQTRAAMDDAKVSAAHLQLSEQQRQVNWGVSIDEEVSQMVVQQKSFAAAARVITVMDEMLDTLVNRTGIVGR